MPVRLHGKTMSGLNFKLGVDGAKLDQEHVFSAFVKPGTLLESFNGIPTAFSKSLGISNTGFRIIQGNSLRLPVRVRQLQNGLTLAFDKNRATIQADNQYVGVGTIFVWTTVPAYPFNQIHLAKEDLVKGIDFLTVGHVSARDGAVLSVQMIDDTLFFHSHSQYFDSSAYDGTVVALNEYDQQSASGSISGTTGFRAIAISSITAY